MNSGRLSKFQRLILRYVPFRVNLFLQLRMWKKGIYFVGLNDKQREIASKKFFKINIRPDPDNPNEDSYGPPFEPPWIAFPEYERYSMGFRMGGGEDYIWQFRKWYFRSRKGQIDNFQADFPEPKHYEGFYADFDQARETHRLKDQKQDQK